MTAMGFYMILTITVIFVFVDGSRMVDELSNVIIEEIVKEGQKLKPIKVSAGSKGRPHILKAAFKHSLPKLKVVMAKYKVGDPKALAVKVTAAVESNPKVRALILPKERDDALSPRFFGGLYNMIINFIFSILSSNLNG